MKNLNMQTVALVLLIVLIGLMFSGIIDIKPNYIPEADYQELEDENTHLRLQVIWDSMAIAELEEIILQIQREKDSIDIEHEKIKAKQVQADKAYNDLKEEFSKGTDSVTVIEVFQACDSVITNRDAQITSLTHKVLKRDELINSLERKVSLRTSQVKALNTITDNGEKIKKKLEAENKELRKEIKKQRTKKVIAWVVAGGIAVVAIITN